MVVVSKFGGAYPELLERVRSRKQTISNAEHPYRSHTIIHCANIGLRLARTMRWDPAAQRFAQDEEANAFLAPR